MPTPQSDSSKMLFSYKSYLAYFQLNQSLQLPRCQYQSGMPKKREWKGLAIVITPGQPATFLSKKIFIRPTSITDLKLLPLPIQL
jgi:hypothetical protein